MGPGKPIVSCTHDFIHTLEIMYYALMDLLECRSTNIHFLLLKPAVKHLYEISTR